MKEQSVTKGFAILSMAGMLAKVLSILYIPMLLHIISNEGYGIYITSYQIYTFMFVLTNSGVPVAISKLISELTATGNYKDAIKSFKIARIMLLAMGTIIALIMVFFARPLALQMKYKEAYLSVLALAPAILFTSIASAYRGYFQGRGNMTPTAVSQVIEQGFNIIFSLLFAFLFIKYGLEAGCAGATIGTTLGALFSALFLMYCYRKNGKIKVNKEIAKARKYSGKKLAKKVIQYGLPITLCVGMNYAGILVDIYNTKSRLMVGGISESQATILYGFLGKYQQLINVPIAIITSLSAAVLPAISGAVAAKNKQEVSNNINYAFRLTLLIAIPSAIGLRVLAKPIYKMIVLGQGYEIMIFGAVVLVFMAIAQIQITILQSIGKLYTATIYSVIGIIVKITVNYILIANPKFNIMGALIGTAVGYTVPIILNYLTIKKELKVKLHILRPIIKPFISGEIMGIIIWFVYFAINYVLGFGKISYTSNLVATIICIFVGATVYGGTLILIGGITKKDLEGMPSKLTRRIPLCILNKMK